MATSCLWFSLKNFAASPGNARELMRVTEERNQRNAFSRIPDSAAKNCLRISVSHTYKCPNIHETELIIFWG